MTIANFRPSFLRIILCLEMLGCICGCAGPPHTKPPQGDRAFNEAIIAAGTAFQQERIDEAATLYLFALKRARAIDQPSAIGNASYNLAACLLSLRQYDHAQILLAEARQEFARIDSPLADVLLLQARAAHLAGDTHTVGLFISQLRSNSMSNPSSAHLGQALVLEGHIACDRNDWSSAADLLEQARDCLGPDTDALLQAQLAGLAGSISIGIRELRSAAEAFDRQVDLLRRTGHYRAISGAMGQAGEAYLAIDEHKLAADRLYRAARSAAAWGDTASAKKWATTALDAARKADESVIARLAEYLLSEFTKGE